MRPVEEGGWQQTAPGEPEHVADPPWPADERERLLSVVAGALRDRCAKEDIALPAPVDYELAVAVLDALAVPADEHVQPGGDADPDDVLVAIVDGMDTTGYAGPLDATSRCGGLVESALDVQRVLLERFVLHPRPTA